MGAIVFFAFILFVMGGVTAYMGDRLGSYIGKKRHSTFGLRPRHTAMLWTVVSGGVIAVGTLLLFVTLNNTFKTALVRGPQLLTANSELSKLNRTLIQRNAAAARQAEAAAKSAQAAQIKAVAAQKTLNAAVGQLSQTKSVLAQSRSVLTQRQAALAAAQQNLAGAKRGLGSTHAELRTAQAQVRLARAAVQEAKRQVQVAGSQIVQANKSVLALVIQQDKLHANTKKLMSQNLAQETQLQASQGHALIFRREEELGRTVVSARQDTYALRRELSVFLDQVELTARQRGAGGLDNAPAIIIPALGEATGNDPAAREAALDALSQNISAEGGFMPSIVVVADARYNTFRGEAVKLDLRPYANILVFSKNAVIAHGTVDGSQPEDVILKRLQEFLTGQVRTEALQRGIIPVHDPQSGLPLVGEPIKSDIWVGLVKQIQQAGPDAAISASAAQDTYSADPLKLDLHVAGG
ncbi:MAG: DUF3084 domain-containing protein [Janthinobacterium lividum]